MKFAESPYLLVFKTKVMFGFLTQISLTPLHHNPHPKHSCPINKVHDCYTVFILQIHEVNYTTEAQGTCILLTLV